MFGTCEIARVGWCRRWCCARRCVGSAVVGAAAFLAALTLFVIAVPEQLVTSRLADMPRITGFYAFAAGTALLALGGESRRSRSAPIRRSLRCSRWGSRARLAPAGSPQYVDLVAESLSRCARRRACGATCGCLRLGRSSEFLRPRSSPTSWPGSPSIIGCSQLPHLLGLAAALGAECIGLRSPLVTSGRRTAGRWGSGWRCSRSLIAR